ncbi:hypothetical protein V5799_026668 [Amblyomma americanum]|uniref:Uncharacterized protein n=1 Tax=Amblyomma americanum TaxID=6943 RepID=A0AAQ4DHX5_AMBAM
MAFFEAAMELLDSDSDDDFDFDDSDSVEEFDNVCILVACALVRQDANRVPGCAFYPSAVHDREKISAEKTCLITLAYIGSQMSMYAIGDKFDVTESSVHDYGCT